MLAASSTSKTRALRPDHPGIAERLGLPVVRAREQVAGDAPPHQTMEAAVAPRPRRFAVVLHHDADAPIQPDAQPGQQGDEAETVHVHDVGSQTPDGAHEVAIARLESVHDSVAFDLRRAGGRAEARGHVDRARRGERVERQRHRRHGNEGLGGWRSDDRRHHDDDAEPSRVVHVASRAPRPRAATRSTVAPMERCGLGHTICSTTRTRSRGPIVNA